MLDVELKVRDVEAVDAALLVNLEEPKEVSVGGFLEGDEVVALADLGGDGEWTEKENADEEKGQRKRRRGGFGFRRHFGVDRMIDLICGRVEFMGRVQNRVGISKHFQHVMKISSSLSCVLQPINIIFIQFVISSPNHFN